MAGPAKKAASSKPSSRSSRSRSAPTADPSLGRDGRMGDPSGDPEVRTMTAAERERAAVRPTQAHGPGSGSKLVNAEGEELSLTDLMGDETETLVVLTDDVHEEHPAPGAPTRMIRKLLFHKGQRVPKSTLERHMAAQEEQAKQARRSSQDKSAEGKASEVK